MHKINETNTSIIRIIKVVYHWCYLRTRPEACFAYRGLTAIKYRTDEPPKIDYEISIWIKVGAAIGKIIAFENFSFVPMAEAINYIESFHILIVEKPILFNIPYYYNFKHNMAYYRVFSRQLCICLVNIYIKQKITICYQVN